MTSREKYADISHARILERPRDALEKEYADSEANTAAKQIWERLGKLPKHRGRVIQLLANELLETMPRSDRTLDTTNTIKESILDD